MDFQMVKGFQLVRGFHRMKQLGIVILFSSSMLFHRRVTPLPPALIYQYPFMHVGVRERHCESNVSCSWTHRNEPDYY